MPSCNNLINHMPTIKNRKEHQIRQHPRSGREVSLRRESLSLRRDPPRVGEMLTQINGAGRLGDPSRENYWASLSSPRLGEIARLGEIISPRPLFRHVTDQKHSQIVQ